MSHKSKNVFTVQVVPEIHITQVQPSANIDNNDHETGGLRRHFSTFYAFVTAFGCQTLSVDLEAQGSSKSIFYALSSIIIVMTLNAYCFLGPKPDMIYYLHFLSEHSITVITFATLYTYMFHLEWILFMEKNGTFADGKPFKRFLVIFSAWYSIVTVIIILYVNGFTDYPEGSINFFPYIVTLPIMLMFIWFEQPIIKRTDPEFRRRLRWFIIYPYAWFLGFPIIFKLEDLSRTIPMTYQPIMAIAIPFAKYVFSKFLSLVAGKASLEGNNSSVKFAVGLRVACQTGLYVVASVGESFSLMTTLILVLVELILNLGLVRKIWKLHQKTSLNAQIELKGTLLILSMREIMELLPTITYCLLLFMLYLGPNKENFRTTRGKTIDDIFDIIKKISYFTLFDVVRIGINGAILWKTCKISMFSECCKLIERYWKVFGWMMALYIYWVMLYKFYN